MGETLCGTYECSMDLRDTRALQETCIKCFFIMFHQVSLLEA